MKIKASVFFPFAVLALMLTVSCHKDIWDELDSINERVSALQTVQKALQERLYVVSVTTVANGVYVTFSDGTSATILNGTESGGGETYIKSIAQGNNDVTFVLSDGTSFCIPLYSAISLQFDTEGTVYASGNTTVVIPFSVQSNIGPVVVEAVASGGAQARIALDQEQNTGSLTVALPGELTEYCKVVVFASNGEKVAIQSLVFEKAEIRLTSSNTLDFSSDGGQEDISILTNIGYEVVIPESAKSWIGYEGTKALAECHGRLTVAPNTTYDEREAVVLVKGQKADVASAIKVTQNGKDGVELASTFTVLKREGGTFTVPYRATGDCRVTIPKDADWISLVETKSVDSHSMVFHASANADSLNREAVLVFSADKESKSFSVRQFGESLTISYTHDLTDIEAPEIAEHVGWCVIDWGDGTVEDYTGSNRHLYNKKSEHKVSITINCYETTTPADNGVEWMTVHSYKSIDIQPLRGIKHINYWE